MKIILFTLFLMYSLHSNADECGLDEIMIASCALKGNTHRTASFCVNEKKGYLYYSFKRNKKEELRVNFSQDRKLKRWVDQWTDTTYFGFSRGEYDYVLGVPEEKLDAVAFLDVKKNGDSLVLNSCISNSFGSKDVKSSSIEDVSDSSVRDNNLKFP